MSSVFPLCFLSNLRNSKPMRLLCFDLVMELCSGSCSTDTVLFHFSPVMHDFSLSHPISAPYTCGSVYSFHVLCTHRILSDFFSSASYLVHLYLVDLSNKFPYLYLGICPSAFVLSEQPFTLLF